jgi:GIY-YIG catalytic domain.
MEKAHGKSVYILRSSSRRRPNYVGITGNFERRLAEHNANHSPYTSGGAPWTPVVVVRFEDDRKAERFEEYLKTGSGRAFAKRHFL